MLMNMYKWKIPTFKNIKTILWEGSKGWSMRYEHYHKQKVGQEESFEVTKDKSMPQTKSIMESNLSI